MVLKLSPFIYLFVFPTEIFRPIFTLHSFTVSGSKFLSSPGTLEW